MRIDGLRFAFCLAALLATSSALYGQSLPDTLTFSRARTLWEANNPQFRAARMQGRATGQAFRAEALFPNPTLSVSEERTNVEGPGVDDQWYLSVTQPLRYPGEQSARAAAASATARAAKARVRETTAGLYRTLRRRYLDVVVAERQHAIHRRYTKAIRGVARAARVRKEEGDLGTMRQARVQAAQARYEDELEEARRTLYTARADLYALLRAESTRPPEPGGAALPNYDIVGALQYRPVSVPLPEALRRALQNRGRMQAARAALEAQQEQLTTARYGRLPSLSVSAGPKTQNLPGSGPTYGFTAALNVELPLWNRGQTNLEATRSRRAEAQARLEAARRQVRADVRTAIEDLRSYRSRIETVSEDMLVGADSLLQNAQYVYQEGDITLFELLDAIEAGRSTVLLKTRLTANYLRALYDLEYALGVGPSDAPVVVEGALDPRDVDFQ